MKLDMMRMVSAGGRDDDDGVGRPGPEYCSINVL